MRFLTWLFRWGSTAAAPATILIVESTATYAPMPIGTATYASTVSGTATLAATVTGVATRG